MLSHPLFSGTFQLMMGYPVKCIVRSFQFFCQSCGLSLDEEHVLCLAGHCTEEDVLGKSSSAVSSSHDRGFCPFCNGVILTGSNRVPLAYRTLCLSPLKRTCPPEFFGIVSPM